jgi:hypothetical protein
MLQIQPRHDGLRVEALCDAAALSPLTDMHEALNWTTGSEAARGDSVEGAAYFAVCLATKNQNKVK